MTKDLHSKLLSLIKRTGILRAKDLAAHKIPREYLSRAIKSGEIVKLGRGIYTATEESLSTSFTLAQVTKVVPHAVIVLLSALRFHEIGTQNPHEVWIAVKRHGYKPKMEYPPLRVFHYSKESLKSGIEYHSIEGVKVAITSIEKTIADCFKFRNKIGIDVCIEALQEAWRSNRLDMNKLSHEAKICRIYNVLRPYAEAIV